MTLWLLRPQPQWDNGETEYQKDKGPWEPWYDKAFGFVVRAETEAEARTLAQGEGEDEIRGFPAWTDSMYSSCVELTADSEPGVVMRDFYRA